MRLTAFTGITRSFTNREYKIEFDSEMKDLRIEGVEDFEEAQKLIGIVEAAVAEHLKAYDGRTMTPEAYDKRLEQLGLLPPLAPRPKPPAVVMHTETGRVVNGSSTAPAPSVKLKSGEQIDMYAEPEVDKSALQALAASSPAKEPKAEKPKKEKAAPTTVQQEIDQPYEEKAAAPEEKTGTTADVKPAEPAAASDEGIEKLKGARKLRDVIAHLQDKGFKERKELEAELVRLTPELPLLQRIDNLPERIERTLAVMDMDT